MVACAAGSCRNAACRLPAPAAQRRLQSGPACMLARRLACPRPLATQRLALPTPAPPSPPSRQALSHLDYFLERLKEADARTVSAKAFDLVRPLRNKDFFSPRAMAATSRLADVLVRWYVAPLEPETPDHPWTCEHAGGGMRSREQAAGHAIRLDEP